MPDIPIEHLELARISQRVYPGPLNQRQLRIGGKPITGQRYVHGSGDRGYCRVFWNEAAVIVAFRGTRESIDWKIANLRMLREPLSDCGASARHVGVHRGFQDVLNYPDKTSGLRSLEAIFSVLDEIEVGSRPLWITGHSLGAACATIFAAKLREHQPALITQNLQRIVLFGAPAVGGKAFREFYGGLGAKTTRYINGFDPVPFAPPIGYRHVGTGYWHHGDKWHADPGWPTRLVVTTMGFARNLIHDHAMGSYINVLAASTRPKIETPH
ncbi:lipase family protein [Devosia sp. CAU 1758]